jgi:hypothetical protein
MKKCLLFFSFMLPVTCIFAEKLAELPQVIKPEELYVDGNRLYILSQARIQPRIYAYAAPGVEFIKQFVKIGEGPAEARRILSFKVLPHLLIVQPDTKIMFYSRDGEYIKEKRIPQDIEKHACIGENYIGIKHNTDEKAESQSWDIYLFDKDFNPIKELRKGEAINTFSLDKGKKRNFPVLSHLLAYNIYKDRIYIADTQRGFSITVCDREGEQLYEINKKYKKLKGTQVVLDKYLSRWKSEPERLAYIKNVFNLVVPEYYPAVESFWVNNDQMCVLTFEKKKEKEINKRELVVLDLTGRILKRTFVTYESGICSVYNDKYYYLFENEEKELWELHTEEIK